MISKCCIATLFASSMVVGCRGETVAHSAGVDAQSDDVADADVELDGDGDLLATETDEGDADTSDDASSPDPTTWAPRTVTVGADACCLNAEGGLVVWVEGGALKRLDTASGLVTVLVAASEPGTPRDPAIVPGGVAFADDRDGDYDLFLLRDGEEVPESLIVAQGDQDGLTADGTLLAWLDRRKGDGGARDTELWALDFALPGSARAITDDAVEQDSPHLRGGLLVFTDYSHDPDGEHLGDPSAPFDQNENNADIASLPVSAALFASDAEVPTRVFLTDDPSKQARPATDGTTVAWLDWRGISPEPKYSEFQVYSRSASGGLERMLGKTSWSKPQLWKRPAVAGDHVAWVHAPLGEVPRVVGTRLSDSVSLQLTTPVADLRAIELSGGTLIWLGGAAIQVVPDLFP